MSRRFWLVGLAMLTLGGLAFDGPARAEIVRLKSGRMLQGEIDSARTTDESIIITLYRDGAVLRVLWDHVLGRDKSRLREALGLDVLEGETLLMPGHELLLTTGESMRGLIVDPPEGGNPAEFWYLKTANGGRMPQALPRRLVQTVNEIEIPILEVYSPDEAVERKVLDVVGGRDEESLSWQDHMVIADFAYKLPAYAQAKAWYEKSLEDEANPERTAVQNKLKNLDILVQAAEAGDLFGLIKRYQFLKKYREALATVGEFREKFGTRAQVIAIYKLDQVEKRLQVSLKQQRIQRIASEWFQLVTRFVSSEVRDKDMSWKDAMAFAQKDLTNQVVQELAKKLEIEPEMVLDLWKQRQTKAHTATFGYGSFAAPEEAAKAKAASSGKDLSREEIRRRLLEAARKRRNQNKSKEKPAKTADEWWKSANSTSRRNWLTAFYVEHGNAGFEIIRTYYELCKHCAGKGYTVANIAQSADDSSGQEKRRCEVCNGHGKIRMIRYK